MLSEFAPKKGSVEGSLAIETAAAYVAGAESEAHTDGILFNQPRIGVQTLPDAGDHNMAVEDGNWDGDEIHRRLRD